jgi:DNA topoisomerase-2
VRLGFYTKRRAYMLQILKQESDLLESKAKFLNSVIDGTITINKAKKDDIVASLKVLGFKTKKEIFSKLPEAKIAGSTVDTEEDGPLAKDKDTSGYNYLLGMSLWQLTKEKVDELMSQVHIKRQEIGVLENKTDKDLWREDLDLFRTKYTEMLNVKLTEREVEISESRVRKEGQLGNMKFKPAPKRVVKNVAAPQKSDPKPAQAKNGTIKLKAAPLKAPKAPNPKKPTSDDSDSINDSIASDTGDTGSDDTNLLKKR